MAAFEVAVGHERVEIALDFSDGQAEGFSPLHPEAFVDQGSVSRPIEWGMRNRIEAQRWVFGFD